MCVFTTLWCRKVLDRFISAEHRSIKCIAGNVRAPIEIQVPRVLTARMWIYGKQSPKILSQQQQQNTPFGDSFSSLCT